MELKIKDYELPKPIEFNFNELKQELAAKAHDYEVMVYGEDQIKDAKADKAALNKLKKALNDERINREREYMKPFNEFKSQINEIISIIDKPIAVIDTQVKEYEKKKQEEKQNAIKELWMNTQHPDFVLLGSIWNNKWLNATFTLKKVEEEINERLAQIAADVKTLESLSEFSFEALEEYKHSLDVGKAIAEGQRLVAIQKAKEEAERRKAEEEARRAKEEAERRKAEEEARRAQEEAEKPTIDTTAEEIPYEKPEIIAEPPKQEGQWIAFKAFLTVENAVKLKKFFEENKIEFHKA